MSPVGSSSSWLKFSVLALFVLALPVWNAAQHEMESEDEGRQSNQSAAKKRELSSSVHKNLACLECHGEMEMEMGPGRVDPVETCGSCHKRALNDYLPSVHAVAFRRGTPHAATCVECHGSHSVQAIKNPQAAVSTLLVSTETCGRCHGSLSLTAMHRLPANVVPDYRASFHGLSAALGDQRVANCASCHSFHEIRPSWDPLSTVNRTNLARTCGGCHEGATASFATGGIHHRPDTPGHKFVDVVRVMYLMMINVTIGLMLVHNGLDFWGRVRERWLRPRRAKSAPNKPLVPEGELKIFGEVDQRSESGRESTFFRFTIVERIQHWTLAASFILLAVTGFALKYTWNIPGLEAQQGAVWRGYIHRAAAVVFMALAVYHVGYMIFTRRGRLNVRALVPRIRSLRDLACRCAACFRLGPPSVPDWRDLIQTVEYNLGLTSTRPAMGRFTYAEKMEYFALIWGSVVMIVTGLILWFEVPFLNRFKYWVFDLATVLHFYEAVLATLAIVVWHFYFTIFNPHVFPLSKTMLTGRIDREEMEREHALELKSLEGERSTKEPNSVPGE